MQSITDLFAGTAGTVGFGSVAGLIVGYTAKKATKLAALILGAIFIVLQLLVYFGVVEVRWEIVQTTAETVWQDAEGVTLADRAWDMLTANLPFGAGFAAGFAIGFKLG